MSVCVLKQICRKPALRSAESWLAEACAAALPRYRTTTMGQTLQRPLLL
jgi:hypothetical protein